MCCLTAWLPALVILCLLAAVIVRTLTVTEKLAPSLFGIQLILSLFRFELARLSEQEPSFLNPDDDTVDVWAETLGGAIRIQTVSW